MPLRCSFGTGNAMPALIPPTARLPVQAPFIFDWPVTPGTSELFIKKPYIGDDDRKIEPADIRCANHLMFFAEGLMVLGLAVLIMVL